MTAERTSGWVSLPQTEATCGPHFHNGVAVVSGKGGVGKTNLVANLAVAASGLGARVLVVDGDLGLANVDVLLGLVPSHTIGDVMFGRCPLHAAVVEGPNGVHVLPAATARSELSLIRGDRLERLLARVAAAARSYDLVLVDAGPGIGETVIALSNSCPQTVLVTTPEPTSLADAYATVKAVCRRGRRRPLQVLVNSVRDESQGMRCYEQLRRLAERFLRQDVEYLGSLPRDARLTEAVAQQRAVVDLFPGAPSSRRLVALAERLLRRKRSGRGAATRLPPARGLGQ